MIKKKSLITMLIFGIVFSLTLLFSGLFLCGSLKTRAANIPLSVNVDGHNLYDGYCIVNNGDTEVSKNVLTEPTNYVAWYKDGVLILNNYDGAGISIDGDLTIKLKGDNKITPYDVGISADSCDNLIIDSENEATLSINALSTSPSTVQGITVGYSATSKTGNCIIKGNVNISIICSTSGEVAFGIYAKEAFNIEENASVKIKCSTDLKNETSYGIFSGKTPVSKTTGTIDIDTSDCSVLSYSIYADNAKIIDMQSGTLLCKYKNNDMNSTASYPKIKNAPAGCIMREDINAGELILKHGIGNMLTIEGGYDYFNESSNIYIPGEIVSVNTSSKLNDLPFLRWEGNNVTFANSTDRSTTFTMPNEDVSIRAVYDMFSNQPVFKRINDSKGSLSFKVNKEIKFFEIELLKDTGEIVSVDFTLDSTSNYTYNCSTVWKNYTPNGNYKIRVKYSGFYFYSESFEIDYTDKTPVAKLSDVIIFGKTNRFIAPISFNVILTNAAFKEIADGTDVTNWFSSGNLPTGLTAKISGVSAGATVATITISGTTLTTSTKAIDLAIPKEYLMSGENILYADLNPNAKYDILYPTSYKITVTDGDAKVDDTSSTLVNEGEKVTIVAAKKDGMIFDKWVIVSGSFILDDINSSTTTFVMPESNVEIKATYKKVVSSVEAIVKGPIKGNVADSSTMSVSGTGYRATEVKWYAGEIVDASALMSATDKFIAGKKYTVVVTLTIDHDYEFADASVIIKKINGQTATSISSSSVDSIMIATIFTIAEDPIPEYKVSITEGKLSDGNTSGMFKTGTNLTISANAPTTGMVFDKWVVSGITLSEEQLKSSTITISVAESDITLVATYKSNGVHKHELISVSEKAATCTENGVKAHYECEGCKKKFKDKEGLEEITDASWLVIPKGHHFGEWKEEVPSTCAKTGTKAHKTCTVCNKHFDKDGVNEITDLTIAINPNGHRFGEWQDEIAATTEKEGIKAHKTCEECKKHFDKDDIEIEDIIIAKLPGGEINPPVPVKDKGLSGGAIAGIVVGSVVVGGACGFSIFWFVIKKRTLNDFGVLMKSFFKKIKELFTKK